MPAWLVAFLIKAVLPTILKDLVAAGLMKEATALALRYGINFEQFLANLKTYPEYPGDPKPSNTVSNINVEQPDADKTSSS